jgi:hypothetical protein
MDWLTATMSELGEQLASVGAQATGPAGGLFARELFTDARGLATPYILARGYGALGTYVAERLIGGSGQSARATSTLLPTAPPGAPKSPWPVLRVAG